MSDSCRCFDVKARVVMNEPKLSGKLDFSGEIILCSDGEDYKRGYEEGHAQGLIDGQADGYKKGYDEGHTVGSESGYSQGKQDGLTEGYDNGYEKGKSDGYKDGYEEGYSKGYEQGLTDGAKEEQEKSISITKNGTTEILPDKNKVLSKVTVEVDVKADDFIGVKYSNYSGLLYNLPRTVDARSLDLILREPSELIENGLENVVQPENDSVMTNLCTSNSTNANGGYFVQLEEAYLPSKITGLHSSFKNCRNLKNIYGDLRNIIHLNGTFYNCFSLTEIPYMPNLETLGNQSFYGCTGLTSITFYKVLKSWHTGALQGATNITEINLVDGWNTSVYAQHCENLTQACLHDMCEKFADMTGKTPLVFKIGEKNIAKIDDEHIAMLQQKNIDYS